MNGLLIFLGSSVYLCGSYLVWPSRYNITAHLNIAFVFIAFFVPAIILNNYEEYSPDIVDLYVQLLTVGGICYVIGLFIGFNIKPWRTSLSFDVLSSAMYSKRVVNVTAIMLILAIAGESFGYLLMGYVPMFAADPLAAKFFRNQYAVPFYVSIIYLSSFFVLSTLVPISLMIWYQDKKKVFFLILSFLAVSLMMMSLARSAAFSGIILFVAVIMSFKNKKTFFLFIILIFCAYGFSSVFYFITGIRNFTDVGFKTDHIFWRVLSSGTIDIDDQLNFLTYFDKNPEWTYGRTVYGGLIPSHYFWNPAVYTLRVVNPGSDLNTLISGGLRLPAPIWGYVSFQWPGVVMFCFLSGMIKGMMAKFTKHWVSKHKTLLIIVIVMAINIFVFEPACYFFVMSNYSIPPLILMLFYMYRIKLK
ncbi:oligosaccharide repeat unit polymerase [Mucilaginibacter gilvus]|uniref:Oligosaccharide repeat unit polymerase n=1 Tax=Mucilaginibacter gilvus TaxID=2305909 RepID=A0A444MLL7_9SPHI|nr:oligosaccharide repeat unit polymerase [Mucilaginibacter gilvus]RWY50197.1 hypothetical protein EPL05_15715 [Mucilaginibacter gilvus]